MVGVTGVVREVCKFAACGGKGEILVLSAFGARPLFPAHMPAAGPVAEA